MVNYFVLKINNSFSPNNKPEQTEIAEEKTETKPDEKSEIKPGCSGKQDESGEKAGRTGNNDSGNCYW